MKARRLTRKERTRLFIILTAAVIVLECMVGLLLRQTSWRLIAGFLVVFAADFITYKLYGKRIMVKRSGIWRNESLEQISTSNLLALVVSIGLSPVYLAFNESAAEEVSRILDGMSFSSGNILTGLSGILQNVPIINTGLAIFVVCWLIFSIGKKPLNK